MKKILSLSVLSLALTGVSFAKGGLSKEDTKCWKACVKAKAWKGKDMKTEKAKFVGGDHSSCEGVEGCTGASSTEAPKTDTGGAATPTETKAPGTR